MRKILLAVAAFVLAGCASSPTVLNLAPANVARAPVPFDLEVKAVTVVAASPSEQTGEVKMDPAYGNLWRDALQASLDSSGLFKDDSPRKITVRVLVRRFQFNPSGLTNTVDVDADYSLIDRSSGQQLYFSKIPTSATMSASDEWVARQRMIKIFNKATQDSITAFIDGLRTAKIP